jgi:hypothetical protein
VAILAHWGISTLKMVVESLWIPIRLIRAMRTVVDATKGFRDDAFEPHHGVISGFEGMSCQVDSLAIAMARAAELQSLASLVAGQTFVSPTILL